MDDKDDTHDVSVGGGDVCSGLLTPKDQTDEHINMYEIEKSSLQQVIIDLFNFSYMYIYLYRKHITDIYLIKSRADLLENPVG